jgi:AcrR family transcriptional regulator
MESVTAHSEREWILVGMAELCASRGFEATTVDDICEAAGVSRDSFEAQFADKAACLTATVDVAIGQARQAIDEATSPQRNWAANLRDGTAALLRFLAGRPTFAHVLLVEAPAAGGHAAIFAESARGEVLAFVERGSEQAADEIPTSAARGALAGAEALVVRRIVAGEAESLAGDAPDTIYMLAVPFLGVAEAQRLAAGAARRRHLRAVA